MSKRYPECPRYEHTHCRDYKNPKICGIIRPDKICKKEKTKPKKCKNIYEPTEHELCPYYFSKS